MCEVNGKMKSSTVDEILAEQLKVLSSPIRMRILAVLREKGSLTVGEIARLIDEPVGSVSYHLSRLHISGLIEEAAEKSQRDKRKSWWKAANSSTVVPVVEPGVDRGTLKAFKTAAMTSYQSAFMRYMQEYDNLEKSWQEAGQSVDSLLELTPEDVQSLNAELVKVIEKYEKLSIRRKQEEEKTTKETDTKRAQTVAVVAQTFRWIS